MPLRDDGDVPDTYILPDITPKCRKLRNGETGFQKEDFALETFRGFEKIPVVILERYNITPYLNKTGERIKFNGKKKTAKNDYKGFGRKCTVNIVIENLELLKERLSCVSPRSDISEKEVNYDMGHLKCKICEKIYSDNKKLLKHQEKKHMIIYKPGVKSHKRVSFSDHVIIHEVKEYHKCRKCTKIFEDYKSLKEHMKHEHKKRKCYICNYCNKKFVDRMFFKVHIKLHCDVCGLLSQSKAMLNDHKRNVCRVLRLHKCKTCDISLYRFMDLKDHSYEHEGSNLICDICKDQFETKCGIAHHIKFLHSKKRPKVISNCDSSLYTMRNLGTERLYLCNFCEESSVDKNIIENHVQVLPDLSNRAMTGYKDYYFCDQCLKKFSTEKDMLQHKWTHFLNTSDSSQVRKKIKMTYKVDEKIPEHFLPKLVIEKLILPEMSKEDEYIDVKSIIQNGMKKPIVDPKSKKTIISKHQCKTCQKYYSSNYCLTRHIATQHSDYEGLRCKVCEETFVWPSLLQSHRCIRINRPEMHFDDARPEVFFDNINHITQNGFDDFNIIDDDDYMNSVDFEIPAPIVTLNEYDETYVPSDTLPLQQLGYKLVMQEVPIEF